MGELNFFGANGEPFNIRLIIPNILTNLFYVEFVNALALDQHTRAWPLSSVLCTWYLFFSSFSIFTVRLLGTN